MVEVSGVGVVDRFSVVVVVVSSMQPPARSSTISKNIGRVLNFILFFLFLPIKMTIRDVGRYHKLPWAVAR